MLELFFCRLVGLSFLAGIIESIQTYTKSRKKVLVRKMTQSFLKNEPSSFLDISAGNGNVRLTRLMLRRRTGDEFGVSLPTSRQSIGQMV